MKRAVVVFAAGHGTRMKSLMPKVLHSIASKPMLDYVLDTAAALSPDQIVLIASPTLLNYLKEHPKALAFPLEDLTIAVQETSLGSGHAMQMAMPHLSPDIEPDIEEVIVLYGDLPFVTKETLTNLLEAPLQNLTMLGMRVPLPCSYGRMITQKDRLLKIVETNDATKKEQQIDLVWTGVLRASRKTLETYLPKLSKSPHTQEYYLTELVKLLTDDHKDVHYLETPYPDNFEGVNDKKTLSLLEARKQRELREKFLEKGVKMIAPETVFFADDTEIGEDTVIHPFVIIGKGVKIGKSSTLFSFCHLEDSVIEDHVEIGPFARLRGHNHIQNHAVIGNFVEVKKSIFGKRAKAKHLAYLGDAELKESVNIGAGAITCNYDGAHKHKTVIEERVIVGVNATLIAPLHIGEDSLIGAGSVITEDVPKKTLALGRARQIIKERKPLPAKTSK